MEEKLDGYKPWSTNDKFALLGCVIAGIALIGSFMVPEVRCKLNIQCPATPTPTPIATSPLAVRSPAPTVTAFSAPTGSTQKPSQSETLQRQDQQAQALGWKLSEAVPLSCANESVMKTGHTGESNNMSFKSESAEDRLLFWIDDKGKRHSYGPLAAGTEIKQQTYDGHVWLIADGSERCRQIFVAGPKSSIAIVK